MVAWRGSAQAWLAISSTDQVSPWPEADVISNGHAGPEGYEDQPTVAYLSR